MIETGVKSGSLAVVGDRDSISAFRAVGMKTVAVRTAEETGDAVTQLAQSGCSVIFITERAAAQIPEHIRKYKTQTFPAIIPIPDRFGTNGLGMQGIRDNVKKAVGFNIFEEEEKQSDAKK